MSDHQPLETLSTELRDSRPDGAIETEPGLEQGTGAEVFSPSGYFEVVTDDYYRERVRGLYYVLSHFARERSPLFGAQYRGQPHLCVGKSFHGDDDTTCAFGPGAHRAII